MRYAWTKTGAALHLAKYTRYGKMTKKTLCGSKASETFTSKSFSGPNCAQCYNAYINEHEKEFG